MAWLRSLRGKGWLTGVFLLAMCCLPGWTGAVGQGGNGAVLGVSSTTISFGNVTVGQTVTEPLTLTSTGTSAVTISGISINGSLFTAPGSTFPVTLNPGQTLKLTLSFYSLHVSTFTGTLTLASNSTGGNVVVNMSAGGVAASAASSVSCSSASLTGAGTDACTVKLAQAAAVGGEIVTLGSSNAAVVVPASVTVAANATSASFTAAVSSVSTAQTATLTATAGGASTTTGLQLNAATPTLTTSTTTINYGNVAVGQTVSQPLTLTSTGTAPVTISGISIAGSLFTASGATFPVTLNPGQSAKLTVSFTSPHVSSFTGVLTVASNSSAGNIVVNMSGAGVAAASLSAVSCSSASLTGAGTDACTVSLTAAAPSGGQVVSLASNNTALVVPASVTVAANATSGSFTATASSVSTAQTVTLTATASGVSTTFGLKLNPSVPTLSINSTTVNFGNVTSGDTATQSVTLTSSGTAPVTISGISIAGSLFTATGVTAPLTLNPGQTATLNLEFNAIHVSSFTGVLTVTSNSSSGNLVVNMSGNGVAQQYQVSLSWDAPTPNSDPVEGYRVYRAVSGSSSYQLMNSSNETQTAYTDSTPQANTGYQYYVTSVDAAGVESTPSNTASVTIP